MHAIRQALRQLVRRKTATLLSVGLLALGVGLAASFYSVLDSALLSGLPFPNGDRLVAFSTRDAAGWPMPLDDYRAIVEAQRSLAWTAPLRTFNTMITRGTGTKGTIGSYVTADLFPRLGIQPALGRGFEVGDEDPTSPPVALISHRLWHGSYGADPGVIGETILLNREPTIVVGVMPEGFRFPLRHDVWGVLRQQGREWSDSFVFGVGMLAEDVELQAARDDLARICALLDDASPQAQPRTAALESFVRANIGDRARGALRAMVFAALGLLLLTCANLANLRLSETLHRQNEFDTRLALGSGPAGLARLLLVENLVVGLIGAVLALVFALALTAILGKTLLAGGYLARIYWIEAQLDFSVARFALALALLATLLGAVAPILSMTVGMRGRRLGQGASPARRSLWARGLVSAQVGLCFTLLVAAGLFSTRARGLLGGEPGFRPNSLSSILLSTYQAELTEEGQRREFFERFVDELRRQSEIVDAATASSPPWGYAPRHPVGLDADPDRDLAPSAQVIQVSIRFFETLELALLAGRDFDDTDLAEERGVAIISHSLSDRLFESSPLDRTITIGAGRPGQPSQRARVVGVVADLNIARTDDADRNLNIYLPQVSQAIGSFVLVRTAPGVPLARPTVERVLSRVAPRVGTLDELSVDQALSSSIWVERRLGQIFSLFGLAALLVTAAGMYAVITVMVRTRERELAIRAAIGARPHDLQRLVLGESAVQLVLGLLVGAGALWAAYRLLDSVLAEGLSWQPPVILAAAGIVALSCLSASWGPTARAARADPTRCLRTD